MRARLLAALVLAAACWGAGTVVSKQALAEIAPLPLLSFQLAVSVATLLVVARIRHEGSPGDPESRRLGRLGLLNPGLAYALSLIGLREITASMSVLLWALEPVLILALAAVVLGERPGPVIVAASAVAIGGFALVVFDPSAGGSPVGVTLTLAGVAACAVYTVAARRWLPSASDSTLAVVLRQQAHALGLAVVVVLALAVGGDAVLPAQVSAGAAISAVASGLLYYTAAYLLYLSALRSVRASVAAASFYLIPVFGVSLGWLAGERLGLLQLAGAVVVVAAVATISTRGAMPERATEQGPLTASA